MSVNGTIQQRLAQDIASVAGNAGNRIREAGQTARASVDRHFSARLDQARFQESKDERDAARIQAREERKRQQELEDQDRTLGNQLKLAGINMTFQQALDTGEWGGWAEIVSNPNMPEEFQSYVEILNKNQGKKSLDRLKLENQWGKEHNAADLAERKFLFEQSKAWDAQGQWKAEQYIREQKLHLEQMKDIRENRNNTNYRQMMTDFVKSTPFIQSPRERDGYLIMLRDAVSNDEITQVWDQIHDRDQARLDNMEKAYRNRVQANAAKAAIGTSPSNFDIDFASDVLNEKLGDRWDAMDKESQNKMARYVADQTRYLSRDQRTASSNEVLQVVDKAISGLEKVDYGWWWGVPDEDFSVGRAQQGDTQDLSNEADTWARQNGIKAGEVYEYGGRRWRFGG